MTDDANALSYIARFWEGCEKEPHELRGRIDFLKLQDQLVVLC
jgi:hypothetical protein